MATLSIRLNGHPEVLDKILFNELEPLIEQLSEDAVVSISINEGGSAIRFVNVEEEAIKSEISRKADEVIKAYKLNQ